MRVQSETFYFDLQIFNLFLYPKIGFIREETYLCKVV